MEGRHCDDYIDDPSAPEALRTFLAFHRAPAIDQIGRDRPVLFAKHEGKRVRVVMASRFGDVGITTDLGAQHGYSMRLPVSELTDFTDSPTTA